MTGRQIRALRRLLDLSQGEVAELAKTSQSSVSLVEKDRFVLLPSRSRIIAVLREKEQEILVAA